MTLRPDISNKLIHFTKGDSEESAYNNLRKIIESGVLYGNVSQYIRGQYKCVCFTEAPLEACKSGFVNYNDFSRYSLFGIMFDKKWIFDQGGRPVIYQPEGEFYLLPEQLRWRHVRFEPDLIDWTWEREWRAPCEELPLYPEVANIVVPTERWAVRLRDEHAFEQDCKVEGYKLMMDESLAEYYREPFVWTVYFF